MPLIAKENKESAFKNYCQNWVSLLSARKFVEAQKLIDTENSYGEIWTEAKLIKIVQDYFDNTSRVEFQNEDLAKCYPELLETESGSILFGFYLPANGEITDLTVEFEFIPNGNFEYAATINDVHVL
ncbi:hypothetical protein ISG33_13870 [Glaciecola sp. MH2013]|uniref:hypothetical protein n=1 Tax=Glaciecola sp. MH2013 TaxID=2785524 RepID=UPI0018A0440C|nr:hypothetical protein [Glaciecola sp. MH2013]MBF7074489.1 hypothetical protein [Glaciecola sp. MH2013]